MKQIKSKKRVKQLGEVFTPPQLVNEMLDKLPQEVWTENKSFLEPACGQGVFLIEILKRKLAHHSPEDSIQSIYGIDIMLDNVQETRNALIDIVGEQWRSSIEERIIQGDSLKIDWPKADVIIGNPPFQNGSNLSGKLYPKFMHKALQNAPIVTMVVPNAWCRIHRAKKTRDLMKSGSLWCDNNVNHHFPGIGDDIGYFIYDSNGPQSCWLYGKEQSLDNFYIDDYHKSWKETMDKIFKGHESLKLHKFSYRLGSSEIKESGTYRCYYSHGKWAKGFRYHDKPKHPDFHKEKLIINRNLWSQKKEKWNEYCFVDKDIDAATWASYYLPEEGEDLHETCENIKSFFALPSVYELFFKPHNDMASSMTYKSPFMHNVFRNIKTRYELPDIVRKHRWTEELLKEVFDL